VKKVVVFVAAAVAIVLGFVVATQQLRERRARELDFMAQERAEVFVRPHSPTSGDPAARVYLVEFSDPACETCATFAPFLRALMSRYPGKVKLVLRYAPFHEGSEEAVRVLEAARLQGKLWETLHLLYATQETWTVHHRVQPERIWEVLPQLPLDLERLRRDAADPRIAEVIRQDLADAQALGVDRTPGIFVNGKPLQPFGLEPLAALLAQEVAAQYPE
jgi:protein-disulfide isomerase